jgi:hypothetical protein
MGDLHYLRAFSYAQTGATVRVTEFPYAEMLLCTDDGMAAWPMESKATTVE